MRSPYDVSPSELRSWREQRVELQQCAVRHPLTGREYTALQLFIALGAAHDECVRVRVPGASSSAAWMRPLFEKLVHARLITIESS